LQFLDGLLGNAEAIAEAVQRPTMRFVPLKSAEQLDLQALHRVCSRLVTQRTAVINQIRGFLLERGLPVRQGAAALRLALPQILSMLSDNRSPRVVRLIQDLAEDWRYLDRRVAAIAKDINELADQDAHCRRLMSAPGVGPIISSAMVAAIGTGDAFDKGRSMARSGTEANLNRRSNHSRPHIEARQPLPANTVYPGGQSRTSEAPNLA
jgi:transposase